MVLRETTKYTYPKSGLPRKFYGCSRWPVCAAAHGAHPNGEPLGVPANKETKEARQAAHQAFDALWHGRGMVKRLGYQLLQEIMGMTADEAHIAKFTKEQCETLIAKIKTLDATAAPHQ